MELPDQLACPHFKSSMYTIGLLFESILFGIFTLIMLCDQYTSVSSNTTKISRMKAANFKMTEEESRFMPADGGIEVNELCGGSAQGRFQPKWLLPIAARFSVLAKSRVFGYKVGRTEEKEEVDSDGRAGGGISSDSSTTTDSDEDSALIGPHAMTGVAVGEKYSGVLNRRKPLGPSAAPAMTV